MQALQPRVVSGEGTDPFWEHQNMPDLDNFLQGLLSEPVDLNASLVPPSLAVSFGLSTESSVSSLPPRAAAALLARQAGGGGGGNSGPPRGGGTAGTAPSPPAQPSHFHQMALYHELQQLQHQAAAAQPRRGLRDHSQQPTAGTVQGQQPGSGGGLKEEQPVTAGGSGGPLAMPPLPLPTSARGGGSQHPAGTGTGTGGQSGQPPASFSGLLTEQQAAARAALGGPGGAQPSSAAGGPSQFGGSGGSDGQQQQQQQALPHMRYNFAQAQQDQAAMVAQFQEHQHEQQAQQQQQAQAQAQQQQQAQQEQQQAAAAMFAQQQAFQQHAFQQQQQAQQQAAAAAAAYHQQAQQRGQPGQQQGQQGMAPADASAAAFFQRQQQQQMAAYGFQNPYAGAGGGGWPGMFQQYGQQYGQYGQQYGGFYPPYGAQMQYPGMQFAQQPGVQLAGGGLLGQSAMPGGSIAGLCGGGNGAGAGQLPSTQMLEVVQQSEGQGGHGEDDLGALKKPRLIWTAALHRRFLEALDKVGGVDKALPKAVMKEMGVNGLTRENVASHLQKHRMRLKKDEEGEGAGGGGSGHHTPLGSGRATRVKHEEDENASWARGAAGTGAPGSAKSPTGAAPDAEMAEAGDPAGQQAAAAAQGEDAAAAAEEAGHRQRPHRAVAAANNQIGGAAGAPRPACSEMSDGRTGEGSGI